MAIVFIYTQKHIVFVKKNKHINNTQTHNIYIYIYNTRCGQSPQADERCDTADGVAVPSMTTHDSHSIVVVVEVVAVVEVVGSSRRRFIQVAHVGIVTLKHIDIQRR